MQVSMHCDVFASSCVLPEDTKSYSGDSKDIEEIAIFDKIWCTIVENNCIVNAGGT